MLTQAQETYLGTLPEDKVVTIFPYFPRLRETAEKLIATVHAGYPDLEGLFGGAAGLGIAGQNDLDIDFLALPQDFENYLPFFIELFGEPRMRKDRVAAWNFRLEGIEVDLWLTDATSQSVREQHALFHLLQSNPDLLKEYENLKLAFDGKPYKDYQRAKYEFYNRILDVQA